MRICVAIVILAYASTSAAIAKVRFGSAAPYVEVNPADNLHYLAYIRHMNVPEAAQQGPVWTAGDNVAGLTPEQIQQIVDDIKALETMAVQKEIFEKMHSAPNEWFTFVSVSHAKRNVKQRLETIAKMAHMNTGFYGYHTNSNPVSTQATTHWALGKPTKFYFRQISGTAFEAITELCDGTKQTKGECLGAIIACVWWGAAQAMGTGDFNQLYPGNTALDMKSSTLNNSPLRNTVDGQDIGVHVPGDWLYLKNHNYTDVIKVNSFFQKGWLLKSNIYYWSGENALYIGQSKYAGLGLQDRTLTEMRDDLMTGYNTDLAQVITNGGQVNGQAVTAITTQDAPAKINWTRVRRVVVPPPGGQP